MKLEDTQPIGSYVMLEREKFAQELMDSKLVIPDAARPNTEILKVVDFGTGEEGVEFNVELGDYVIADRGKESISMRIDDKTILQIKAQNIFAILEDPNDYETMDPLDPYVILEPKLAQARIVDGLIVPAAADETELYMIYAMTEELDEYEEGDTVIVTGGVEFDIDLKTFIACKKQDIIGRIDYD
jgi:co-chaperonin GroES (HSP10)